MTIVPETVLKPKELAVKLGVCERTIYTMQRQGTIPGRLVGGKLRFSWPEVYASLPQAPVAPAHQHRQPLAPPYDLVAVLKQRAKAYRTR